MENCDDPTEDIDDFRSRPGVAGVGTGTCACAPRTSLRPGHDLRQQRLERLQQRRLQQHLVRWQNLPLRSHAARRRHRFRRSQRCSLTIHGKQVGRAPTICRSPRDTIREKAETRKSRQTGRASQGQHRDMNHFQPRLPRSNWASADDRATHRCFRFAATSARRRLTAASTCVWTRATKCVQGLVEAGDAAPISASIATWSLTNSVMG